MALPEGLDIAEVPEPRPEETFDRSQIVAGILPDPLPIAGLGGGVERSPEDEVQTALLSPAPDKGVERLLAIDAGRESDKVDEAGSAFALALAAREQPFAGELYTSGNAVEQMPRDEEAQAAAIPIPTPRPARPGDGPVNVEVAALADVATDASPPEMAGEEPDGPEVTVAAEAVGRGAAEASPAEASLTVASLPPRQEPDAATRVATEPARNDRPIETAAAPAKARPETSPGAQPAPDLPVARNLPKRTGALSASIGPVAVAQTDLAQDETGAANAAIPCARYVGQPMTRCEAKVVRSGGGNADVTVFWPDGGKRVLQFRDGTPEGANTLQDFRFTREADLNMIRVGVGERFEILDAIPMGQ